MKVSQDLLDCVKSDECSFMDPVVMCTGERVDVFSRLQAPDYPWLALGTLDDLTSWMFENVSREDYEEEEFEEQIIRFAKQGYDEQLEMYAELTWRSVHEEAWQP